MRRSLALLVLILVVLPIIVVVKEPILAQVDNSDIIDTNMHVVVSVGQYVCFWVNVNNTGSSTWNESYRLRFYVDGVLVNETFLNISVNPGNNVTLWVIYPVPTLPLAGITGVLL